MAESFDCPHCDAFYSIMPTLVGRKVRCNRCKNVFQLQPDGIAIKVGVPSATASSSQTALEKSTPEAARGIPVKKQRSHTAAIRKDTQRIQKMRSSLQDMANKAIEDIDKHDALDVLEGLERKPQSQQS
ncbi:MAG: hypothetical protein HRU15_09590 [Planctomycetes bacterium]|nr:hypothetical protein [Planctomycetota bacterium]